MKEQSMNIKTEIEKLVREVVKEQVKPKEFPWETDEPSSGTSVSDSDAQAYRMILGNLEDAFNRLNVIRKKNKSKDEHKSVLDAMDKIDDAVAEVRLLAKK